MSNQEQNREQQRLLEQNKIFAGVGQILANTISISSLILLMDGKSETLTNLAILVLLMTFWMRYQLFPAILGVQLKGSNPLINFFYAFVSFLPKIQKDILYLRWVTTGKDHPILKSNEIDNH